MSGVDEKSDRVPGERDQTPVARVSSLQSRLGNVLAIGFMSVLGLGALAWYYAHALGRDQRATLAVQAAAASRAQGDAPLPSLGRIGPVPPIAWDPPPTPDPTPLPQQSLVEIPLDQPSAGAPPQKSPEQLTLERQLNGGVLSSLGSGQSAGHEVDAVGAPNITERGGSALRRPEDGLAAMLQPTVTPAVRARVLPVRRLLLPKGAFVDCTLETAIDSSLPGMTTCVTATDTFGADGAVVLMERGTKLVGETLGEVTQGGSRIFVLWTEARTPAGVIVPLDSPAADELGRSGLSGEVNRHFWQRFGAAMLVSVIDGAVEAAAQSSRSGGAVIVTPSQSQGVLTEILKSTVNIPPTVVKRNGDRIQVLVARDLDFRSVYQLRPTATGR